MSDVAARLDALIRFRSDLHHGDEPALAEFLAGELRSVPSPPDELITDLRPRDSGGASGWVFARWGAPSLLVNAHLDTVPPNDGWSGDPFIPRLQSDRMVGLGACDTKGAAAAILGALHDEAPRDLAVLFSGDEESGGRVVPEVLKQPYARGLRQAIVCEPTSCRVGVRHRGILALEIAIQGPGGHSSRADHTRAPLAELARLATPYDDWGRRQRNVGPPGFQGMCLNIAEISGGIAFNVIPARGMLCLSVRCPPDADPRSLRRELEEIARTALPDAAITAPLDHPPFRTRDVESFAPWLGDRTRTPIDLGYWTEAALYSAAGIDAVVFGPGDIAQAHSPDEWVALEQLEQARGIFSTLFRGLRARASAG